MMRQWMRGLLAMMLSVGIGAATVSAETFSSEEELNRYVSSVSLASDQAMFIVRSLHPNIIDLEFYADARKHAWPGGNQVYTVKDSHWHTYILNCRRGEKICYGAGVRGSYNKYWGVGINRRANCSECCYTCNGKTSKLITLRP
ncbi:MAG: hypothetical protein ACOYLQ_01905 [Hyphomicrobiaceae bacterium]